MAKQKSNIPAQEDTPLQIAIQNKDIELARKLIIENKVDVNELGEDNTTALHYASNEGNIELVQLLIDNNAIVDAESKMKITPLMSAIIASTIICTKNIIEIVKFLVSKGADINTQMAQGLTPLHCVVATENLILIKELINLGAGPVIKGDDQRSAIDCANKIGNTEIIDILLGSTQYKVKENLFASLMQDYLEKSYEIQKQNVNKTDSLGKTKLHYAAIYGKSEEIKKLIDLNASINVQDNLKTTPLIEAANYNHTDVINLLIEKNADVGLGDIQELNALHIAAIRNHWQSVAILLDNNANINAQALEATPLHFAIKNNSYDVAIMLIENGADLTIKYNNTFNAFELAVSKNNPSLAKIIYRKTHDEFVEENYAKECYEASNKIGQERIFKLLESLKRDDVQPVIDDVQSAGQDSPDDSNTDFVCVIC